MGEANFYYFTCLKLPESSNYFRKPYLKLELKDTLVAHNSRVKKMSKVDVFFDMTIGGRPAGRIVMTLFARARKASDTKARDSIASSPGSCAKAATLPEATAPEASPSTATNFPMKTSSRSTPDRESFPWPMPAPTPTEANSSCAPLRQAGWMANTSSLDG